MRQFSFFPESLRGKFIAAFACMSIVPLLVCIYIVTVFVAPTAKSIWPTSITLLLTMVVSFCGFYVMEEVNNSIITLSREARRIAMSSPAGKKGIADANEVESIRESLSILARELKAKSLSIKELKVMDESVGAFTERYIRERLIEELERSIIYSRPCAVLVARFIVRPSMEKIFAAEGNRLLALSCLASFLNKFAGELGKIGRLGHDKLCLILPERSRKEAVEIAEKILAAGDTIYWDVLSSMADWEPELAVGVAASPVDGAEMSELFKKCLAV